MWHGLLVLNSLTLALKLEFFDGNAQATRRRLNHFIQRAVRLQRLVLELWDVHALVQSAALRMVPLRAIVEIVQG